MPKKVHVICLNCGKEKTARNTRGMYCSNKCQHAYTMMKKIVDGTASARTLRRYLIETQEGRCSKCGINKWNGKPIVVELEHKNGNSSDDNLDNVCLLCPNCHSQTPTYKNRNKGNGRHFRRQRYEKGLSY